MKKLIPYAILVFSLVAFSSCSSVKAYDKIKLKDAEMELGARRAEKFEQNFQLQGQTAAKVAAVVVVIKPKSSFQHQETSHI
jgi:hypothetical protein